VASATELVAEIGLRFKQGDSAAEQVAQLESRLAAISQRASGAVELPPDLRDRIAALLSRVQETVAAGDEWLARTGPELATQHARQRLRRAYGVT
jgi:phage shock protein A